MADTTTARRVCCGSHMSLVQARVAASEPHSRGGLEAQGYEPLES
jgi:hypothetical protein